MRKVRLKALAGLVVLFAIGASRAQAGQFLEATLGGCTGDVCVVADNMGGDLLNYLMAAREALKEHKQIVIDGWCVSACSIVADRIRSHVCITSNARFGFHKTWALVLRSDGPAYSKPGFHKSWTYTPALQRWINKKGGEPVNGLLVMSSDEAAAFWPRCRQSFGF
jgi:hypothetical protein